MKIIESKYYLVGPLLRSSTNQLHVLDCRGLETVCSLITPEVITFPAQLSMSFTRPLENKGFDLIMATFQKLIIVNVSIGLKGIINHV